jgi:hypothetical protein
VVCSIGYDAIAIVPKAARLGMSDMYRPGVKKFWHESKEQKMNR